MRLLIGCVLLSLAACGGGSTPDPSQASPAEYRADFKSSTLFFTQMSKPVDNFGLDANKYVHKLQRTWYSANVQGALAGSTLDVPVGTVAIKETYDGAGNPSAQVVMVKKAKDTWFYEVRKTDGTVDAAAPSGDNVPACHGCHSVFKEKDYLAGTDIMN
ncbi:MAG: hypothetical protein ACOZIN_22030 [Myxococcota bacterium]